MRVEQSVISFQYVYDWYTIVPLKCHMSCIHTPPTLLSGLYLRFVEVFNTNTVHDRSKRPGFLRLSKQCWSHFLKSVLSVFFSFTWIPCWNSIRQQPTVHLLLCSDELVFLQLPVCECNDDAGRAWRGHLGVLRPADSFGSPLCFGCISLTKVLVVDLIVCLKTEKT